MQPKGHTFKVYPHQGKGKLRESPSALQQGVLDQLRAKLRAWEKTLNPATDRVVLLVDADEQPCKDLKDALRKVWQESCPNLPQAACIAVEETEAFYLGDLTAMKAAFPKAKKPKGYIQDSVCGTWEAFQRAIGTEREDKVGWAAAMGPSLDAKGGKSPSAQFFAKRLRTLCGANP